MLRRWLTVVLLVGCLGGAAWVVISVAGDDADEPAGDKNVGFDVVGAGPSPGDHVLAEGSNWTFLITPQQALELQRPSAVSRTWGWTQPVTLNEASAYEIRRGGRSVTLIAGPVDEEATEVVIETREGASAEGELIAAHDLQWFFAEMPGSVRVSGISARDADGEVVDEYTLPPMLPDKQPHLADPAAPPDRP